jgi:hypothetical protein
MQVISNPATRIHDVGCRRGGPAPARPGLIIENLTELAFRGAGSFTITLADFDRDHLA